MKHLCTLTHTYTHTHSHTLTHTRTHTLAHLHTYTHTHTHRYPGLSTDDLMYVKLGHGPEGQPIDFEKLQVRLLFAPERWQPG